MIKYPNKKVLSNNTDRDTSFSYDLKRGNKGISFEEMINRANEHYAHLDKAYIYKKPTPIKILKTSSYTENFQKKVEIKKAIFEKKSTTDYNGIYKSRYIDFEAKETKYKSFNVGSNLHKHQREHLNNIINHGGIAFLIIRFLVLDKIYIIDARHILAFEKSLIPHDFFTDFGIEIEQNNSIILDYLKAVDTLMQEEKNE